MFNVLLHPLGTGLFHVFRDVSIDIQSKRRSSMAQVFLNRLYIVAILKRQHSVCMPEIMDPGLWSANRVCKFFEVDQDSLRMQMTAKLISKHNSVLPVILTFPSLL